MAFWNAPKRTNDMNRKAVSTALACLDALHRVNEKLSISGFPLVRVGIGLNSGPCSVGNMGSSRRLSYTCVGDAVNLASRLEGLTRLYNVNILVGNETAQSLDGFALLELDLVAVKGRRKPERVWTAIGTEGSVDSRAFSAIRGRLGTARSHYLNQDWTRATESFEALGTCGPLGSFDPPHIAGLFLERIRGFQTASVGADWDSVFCAVGRPRGPGAPTPA